MSMGYASRPTPAASAPCLADLSLNWVIRMASPMPVMQVSTHASCACSGTWDWTNSVERSGSMPPAMNCAAATRVRSARAAGSCGTVMACRSGMKKNASKSAWVRSQFTRAPR